MFCAPDEGAAAVVMCRSDIAHRYTDVGPDRQWALDVMLANPDEWAMVTATSAPSEQTPNIHCVLAVDGVVVATDAGPKGALCSLRSW